MRVAAIVSLVLALLLAACSGEKNGSSAPRPSAFVAPSSASAEPPSPDVPDEAAPGPRAEGRGTYGTLTLVPSAGETVGTLGAPSCYGSEDDATYSGSYEIRFRNVFGGDEQTVGTFEGTLRAKADEPEKLPIEHIALGERDVFFFPAETNDCRGWTYAFYGAGSDGNAFPIVFDLKDGEPAYGRFSFRPSAKPIVGQRGIIRMDGYGDSGNMPPDPVRYTFKLEGEAMILQKKEPGRDDFPLAERKPLLETGIPEYDGGKTMALTFGSQTERGTFRTRTDRDDYPFGFYLPKGVTMDFMPDGTILGFGKSVATVGEFARFKVDYRLDRSDPELAVWTEYAGSIVHEGEGFGSIEDYFLFEWNGVEYGVRFDSANPDREKDIAEFLAVFRSIRHIGPG